MKWAIGLFAACLIGTTTTTGSSERRQTVEAPPLSVTITAEKSYKLLHPVRIQVTMTNHSGQMIETEMDFEIYRDFEVTAALAGKPIRPTAYRDALDANKEYSSKPLWHDAKKPTVIPLDANLINDMTIPGVYKIQVVYKYFDHGTKKSAKVKSNTLPVEILRN